MVIEWFWSINICWTDEIDALVYQIEVQDEINMQALIKQSKIMGFQLGILWIFLQN